MKFVEKSLVATHLDGRSLSGILLSSVAYVTKLKD